MFVCIIVSSFHNLPLKWLFCKGGVAAVRVKHWSWWFLGCVRKRERVIDDDFDFWTPDVWELKKHQSNMSPFLVENESPRLNGMSRFLVAYSLWNTHRPETHTDQQLVPIISLSFRKQTQFRNNATISSRPKLLGRTWRPTFDNWTPLGPLIARV